jgi:hypothetical protein
MEIGEIYVDLMNPNIATGIFTMGNLPASFSLHKDSNKKYLLKAKLAIGSITGKPPYDHWYLDLIKIQD